MSFIARVFLTILLSSILILGSIVVSFHFVLPHVNGAPHESNYVRRSKKASCEIPKIIHQTWKTGQVQSQFAERIKSWVRRNPEWEYRFWTNEDNRNLVKTHYPQHLEMFDKYPQNIQRADAIRYFILDKYGGIYADLDFEALQPFDNLVASHDLILGQEPFAHSHVLYDIDSMICNAIMASCPGHPFWKIAHEELQLRKDIKTVRATGPKMLSGAVQKYQQTGEAKSHPVFIPNPEVFYPFFDDGNVGATNLRAKCSGKLSDRQKPPCKELESLNYRNKPLSQHPDSFAVHHWAHTWLGQVFGSSTIDVRKVMKEEQQRIKSCSAEQQKYCSGMLLGDKRVKKCLQKKLEEDESSLSTECRMAWFRSQDIQPVRASHSPRSGVAHECDADKKKFCGQVKSGGGRTHKCMKDAFAAGSLSRACAKAEFGSAAK